MNNYNWKNSILWKISRFSIMLMLVLFLSLNSVHIAHAAGITVTTTDDELDGSNGSGYCSLREAVENANNNNANQVDCAGGSGDDIISLPAGTYTLGAPTDDINITDNLTINGDSMSNTIIQADNNPNTATGRVIYIQSSTIVVTLNNITIRHGNITGSGGGILNDGTLNINNSIIADNDASSIGGGLFNNGGTLTVNNSRISGNYAGVRGGGVENDSGGPITISTSTLTDNEAPFGGGINSLSSSATGSVDNCLFTNNQASNRGGGINVYLGALTVTNSTLSANTGLTGAALGGGDRLTIINSTIVSNTTSTSSNGSVYHYGGTFTMTNTIVASELNASNNCYSTGTITDGGFNLEDADDCDFLSSTSSITNTAPLLEPLADNGGPTLTHALQPASPAIDVVPNGSSAHSIDQRGAARDYDSNTMDTNTTNLGDIGAYEVRETQTAGSCGGTPLSGDQSFIFASNTVTITVNTHNGLTCIAVEEMGANHLLATGPGTSGVGIQTGNWFHITGDVTNGFDVDITLPYSDADANSRVCKSPGNLGGAGWDCGNGTNTTYVPNTSVTRSSVSSFSDWAAGDAVGPTVFSLSYFEVKSSKIPFGILLGLAMMSSLLALRRFGKY